MSAEAEDMLNEVEVWIERTIAALRESVGATTITERQRHWQNGVEDGLLMAKGAVGKMREELG